MDGVFPPAKHDVHLTHMARWKHHHDHAHAVSVQRPLHLMMNMATIMQKEQRNLFHLISVDQADEPRQSIFVDSEAICTIT